MNLSPSEYDLHAYVDGQLDEERRREIEQWLAAHPDSAAEIHAWRRDAQRLRAALAGQPRLTENPALDPARLRLAMRQRVRHRWATAAMLLLALSLGGAGGWQAHSLGGSRLMAPMQDAMAAYRLLALDRSMAPDLWQRRDGELQAWLDQHFAHAERLPDLAAVGFQPVGGRLLSTDQGAAAMVIYHDRQGRALSFYIRPPGPARHLLPRGQRRDGGLLAEYWSDQGYNYAMVAADDGAVVQAMRSAWGRPG